MFIPRTAPRLRLTRPATLDLPRGVGPAAVIAARTIDLGAGGVGLLVTAPLPVGLEVVVIVGQDDGQGLRRTLRWAGRVTHARPIRAGFRIGVAFASEGGPMEQIQVSQQGRARAVIRLDPAWGEPRAVPRITAPAAPRPDSRAARIAMGTASLGLLADQVIKARAFGLATARHLVVKNFGAIGGLNLGGPPAHQALAILGLLLAGAVARWAFCGRSTRGPLEGFGWGCLLAGMLGNAADRLALGYVRDVLRSSLWPSWVFNPADALAILGVACLALAWATARRPDAHGHRAGLARGDRGEFAAGPDLGAARQGV